MEQATKQKERDASELASYLKPKESDIEKQKKRFQLESVKEEICKNTMSIDRGNEILLNSVKTENKKILQNIRSSKSIKKFISLMQIYNSDLDQEMKEIERSRSRSKSRSRSPNISLKQIPGIKIFDEIKPQKGRKVSTKKSLKSSVKSPKRQV